MVVLNWKDRMFHSPRAADRNSSACACKFHNENYLALKVHEFFNISLLFQMLWLEKTVTKRILTMGINYKHTSTLYFCHHVGLLTLWRKKKKRKELFTIYTSNFSQELWECEKLGTCGWSIEGSVEQVKTTSS